MAKRMTWRERASEVILRTLAELPEDADTDTKVEAVRAAYPFGERKRRPYKIWCDEVQRLVYGRSKEQRKRERQRQKEIEAGQLSLF